MFEFEWSQSMIDVMVFRTTPSGLAYVAGAPPPPRLPLLSRHKPHSLSCYVWCRLSVCTLASRYKAIPL